MADGDVINRAFLEIDGNQVVCESIDPDFEDKTEVVEAMTRDNLPIGVVHGVQMCNIKASVAMREGEEDTTDFLQLWIDKTKFSVGIEYLNGRTVSFGQAVLSKPAISSKHAGYSTWSLEIKAWEISAS